jgi:DNA-binding response OmpR family regulator
MMCRSKILIVDDDPGLVRLLALLLKKRYEIVAELDATQALEAVVKFKPDLVLLDWVMPHLSGGDIAQRIRSDSRVSDTRILFLSAIILKREPAGEVAGYPALAKPIGMQELIEAIDEQLRKAA